MGCDTPAYEGTMKRLLAVVVAAALACPATAQTFEASNGSKFRVLKVAPANAVVAGKSSLVVMVDDDGNIINFLFDCVGMRYGDPRIGIWRSIPSRSVLAQISRLACEKRK